MHILKKTPFYTEIHTNIFSLFLQHVPKRNDFSTKINNAYVTPESIYFAMFLFNVLCGPRGRAFLDRICNLQVN